MKTLLALLALTLSACNASSPAPASSTAVTPVPVASGTAIVTPITVSTPAPVVTPTPSPTVTATPSPSPSPTPTTVTYAASAGQVGCDALQAWDSATTVIILTYPTYFYTFAASGVTQELGNPTHPATELGEVNDTLPIGAYAGSPDCLVDVSQGVIVSISQ